MSYPYRDPHYQPKSGHYQTSANVPGQSEQQGPPFSTTQNPYSISPSQHGPTHPEDWQHPHPSGHSGGHPPYAVPEPTHTEDWQHPHPSGHSGGYPPYAAPEPYTESSPSQRTSAGHSTIYGVPPPPQTMHQSTVGPYQQERQPPYDYHTSGGSSDSHNPYPTASSDTSGSAYARSEFQPHLGPSSAFTHIDARSQPLNLNAPLYDEGSHPSDFLPKSPSNAPIAGRRPQCRYPSCYNYAFVDPRVNELREWCSDNHMRAAVQMGIEKPCKQCREWPRRNGSHYCSGNVCRYRHPGWS